MDKLIIDHIEENYAVCENPLTKEILNVALNKINYQPCDGDVIKLIAGYYIKDEFAREERLKIIRTKMKHAKHNKKNS